MRARLRAGIKTREEWLALPEDDRIDHLGYDLYLQDIAEEWADGLIENETYTPEAATFLMLAERIP